MQKTTIALAVVTAQNNLALAAAAGSIMAIKRDIGHTHRSTPAFAMGGAEMSYLHPAAESERAHRAMLATIARSRSAESLGPVLYAGVINAHSRPNQAGRIPRK